MSIPLKMHSALDEKETEAAANKGKLKSTTELHNLLVLASEPKKKPPKKPCNIAECLCKIYHAVLLRFSKATDDLGGFHTAYRVFVS